MSEQQQVAAVEQPPPQKTAQQLLEEQKQRQEQEKARQEQRKKLEQEARVKRQEDMKKLQQALKGSLSGLSKSADNTSMINTKLTLAEKQLQRVFPSILKFNNILHLDINTNSLSDISILTQFSHLLTLNLSKNQIPSLDAFASDGKLLKLQFLNLSSNKIKQFTQVSLPSLRKLNLNENQINIVKNWKGHANISILELRKNKFKNLKGIVNMKNLTQLYVCENQISDIRGLEGLNALAKLSVRNNKIKKIMKPFPYLPSLIHLNLRENQIPNIKELAKIDEHVLIINLLANPATDELGQNLKKQVCWLLPHITKINKSAVTQEERLGFEKERLEKISQQQKQRLQKQQQARKAAEQPPAQ